MNTSLALGAAWGGDTGHKMTAISVQNKLLEEGGQRSKVPGCVLSGKPDGPRDGMVGGRSESIPAF